MTADFFFVSGLTPTTEQLWLTYEIYWSRSITLEYGLIFSIPLKFRKPSSFVTLTVFSQKLALTDC